MPLTSLLVLAPAVLLGWGMYGLRKGRLSLPTARKLLGAIYLLGALLLASGYFRPHAIVTLLGFDFEVPTERDINGGRERFIRFGSDSGEDDVLVPELEHAAAILRAAEKVSASGEVERKISIKFASTQPERVFTVLNGTPPNILPIANGTRFEARTPAGLAEYTFREPLLGDPYLEASGKRWKLAGRGTRVWLLPGGESDAHLPCIIRDHLRSGFHLVEWAPVTGQKEADSSGQTHEWIDDGDAAPSFQIYKVRPNTSPADAEPDTLYPAKLIRCAAFRQITFRPPAKDRRAPATLRLGLESERRRSVALGDTEGRLTLNSPVALSGDERAVSFGQLGSRLNGSIARATLRSHRFDLFTAWKASPEQPYRSQQTIGDDSRLVLAIDQYHCPWWLVAQVILTGAFVIVFAGTALAQWQWFGLLGAVATLTNLRLGCAWAATIRPPLHAEATSFAAAFLTLAPTAVLVARAISLRYTRGWRPGTADSPKDLRLLTLVACIVGIVPERLTFPAARFPMATAALVLVFAGLAVCAGLNRAGTDKGRWALAATESSWLLPVAWAFGTAILRGVLWFFGWGESVPLGSGRLQLSTVFVPFYLLLLTWACGILWQRWKQYGDWQKLIIQFFLVVCAITGCYAAVAFLVRDYGLLVYAIPPSLLLFVIALQSWASAHLLRRNASAAWFLAMPLAVITFSLAAPRFEIGLFEKLSRSEFLGETLDDMDSLVVGEKKLRLLQYIAPEKLYSLGTRESERMAQHLAVMEDYAHLGFHEGTVRFPGEVTLRGFGVGFLQVPIVNISATCMSDNAVLVFVLAQFGIPGLLGTLGAFALLSCCAGRWPGIPESNRDLRSPAWTLATLCLVHMAFSSAYMAVANCLLLPFTGRNMYFLGLNSPGDVVETTILLALAAIGIAVSGRPPPAQTPA